MIAIVIVIIMSVTTCAAVRMSAKKTFLPWRPGPTWVSFAMSVDLASRPVITPDVPKVNPSTGKNCRACKYCEVDESGWSKCVLFPVASVKTIPGQLPIITLDNTLCTDARANASQCGREGYEFVPKP